MDMGRMLGKRHLVRDPVVITVRSAHTQWFYDKLCSRAERIINNGRNNVLNRTIGDRKLYDARSFCECGKCEFLESIPLSYAYCCKEAMNVGGACSSAAQNLATKIGTLSCITKHPSFASVCLDEEVLNILATHEGVCVEWPRLEETFTNQDYRYIAFRAFSYWAHGDDSRGNKFEAPLCVLANIIQKFPLESSTQQQKGLLNIFGVGFFTDYKEDE
uniref:P2RX7_C domain-containing protein n=1 Tax=Ascaris lumbricoides TaxID=6252 RepID=A0A0M3I562_ASCLU